MKGFIEVTTREGKHLINIRGILEIIPEDEGFTTVYTQCEFSIILIYIVLLTTKYLNRPLFLELYDIL